MGRRGSTHTWILRWLGNSASCLAPAILTCHFPGKFSRTTSTPPRGSAARPPGAAPEDAGEAVAGTLNNAPRDIDDAALAGLYAGAISYW